MDEFIPEITWYQDSYGAWCTVHNNHDLVTSDGYLAGYYPPRYPVPCTDDHAYQIHMDEWQMLSPRWNGRD